ncbi:MAG TPA: hypothetical protein VGE07_12645 [Herpetosiphonaceae bacterium]
MLTVQALLEEFESLPHGERLRRMVALGAQSAADPGDTSGAARLLDDLAAGDTYQRMLAAYAGYGSSDAASALAGLGDPSAIVRRAALLALLTLGDPGQISAGLDQLPAHRRGPALRHLRKRRRQEAADAYLELLAERGDPLLPRVLAYGSDELVARHLPAAREYFDGTAWTRLATHHPDLTAAELLREAQAAEATDQRLIYAVASVFPQLAKRVPGAALALLRAMTRHTPLYAHQLQALAEQLPNEAAALEAELGSRPLASWGDQLPRLAPEHQRRLLEQGALQSLRPAILRKLPPARRLALYELAGLGWRDADGVIDQALIGLLPAAQRQAEARRHWRLPALQTRPRTRLAYLRLLPWDEAMALGEQFLRNPDPELRALALPALIGAARYDDSRLDAALALLTARKHEQDPVRQSGLAALAALPPSRWRPEHLPALAQIIRDALDAKDCSHVTAGAAELLVFRTMPFHPDWSVGQLSLIARERGQLVSPRAAINLSDRHLAALDAALAPVLRGWAERERESIVLVLARLFGRRLRLAPALLDRIEQVARESIHAGAADHALRLLLQADSQRADRIILELLRADPSWIVRHTMYEYLHRKRQELFDAYLADPAVAGRFATGKTRAVLPLNAGFERWTSRQQQRFAALLEQATRDQEQDSPFLIQVVGQLAALPAAPIDRLLELSAADNPQVLLRDIALYALADRDGGDGLPHLLAALGDERARVAIYALRRNLRELPAPAALDLLRNVPMAKVTVAKETIRLIGEVRSDEAFRHLLALSGQDLHRDVRIALLRALWDWAEQPETWPIFFAAAADPSPPIAGGVIRIPADRLSAQARERLIDLLATLLAHPEPAVRLETLQRCAELPLSDRRQALAGPISAAVTSPIPDEAQAALLALLATYARDNPELLRAALDALRGNRRTLKEALDQLKAKAMFQPLFWRPTLLAAIALLDADPVAFVAQAPLAVSALPAAELAPWLAERAALLHADALSAIQEQIDRMGFWRTDDEKDEIESGLAAHGDERLRRLAVAMLEARGDGFSGWTPELRARLAAYQADPALLVASAAQWIIPPPADETADEQP